jgi:membrane protease YdiL (CAAX protease family)
VSRWGWTSRLVFVTRDASRRITSSTPLDRGGESRFAAGVSQLQLSVLLSLVCVALLAVMGRRPYVEECRGRFRQTIAAFLLIGILAIVVFYPVTSFGEAEDIDLEMLWFPSLLTGHVVLTVFLLLWWRLRGDVSLAVFLHLSGRGVWEKIRRGVVIGCGGWVLTVMVTGAAAAAMAATGRMSGPDAVPPIMVWLAHLPILYKLIIVGAAMTVEEAFFRGFLQPRVGLVASSLLFAMSHFSYGLPFMIVGVFTISLVIGRTLARTGDLLPCIVAHGVFDGVQLLIILPWAVHMWSAGLA